MHICSVVLGLNKSKSPGTLKLGKSRDNGNPNTYCFDYADILRIFSPKRGSTIFCAERKITLWIGTVKLQTILLGN